MKAEVGVVCDIIGGDRTYSYPFCYGIIYEVDHKATHDRKYDVMIFKGGHIVEGLTRKEIQVSLNQDVNFKRYFQGLRFCDLIDLRDRLIKNKVAFSATYTNPSKGVGLQYISLINKEINLIDRRITYIGQTIDEYRHQADLSISYEHRDNDIDTTIESEDFIEVISNRVVDNLAEKVINNIIKKSKEK